MSHNKKIKKAKKLTPLGPLATPPLSGVRLAHPLLRGGWEGLIFVV
jgi:hypothetical protein